MSDPRWSDETVKLMGRLLHQYYCGCKSADCSLRRSNGGPLFVLAALAEAGLLVPPRCAHHGWYGLYCAREQGHDGRHAVGGVRWPIGTPEFRSETTGSPS